MKNLIYIVVAILVVWSCKTSSKTVASSNVKEKTGATSDTVRIANDALQYEIIIIDPGFNSSSGNLSFAITSEMAGKTSEVGCLSSASDVPLAIAAAARA